MPSEKRDIFCPNCGNKHDVDLSEDTEQVDCDCGMTIQFYHDPDAFTISISFP